MGESSIDSKLIIIALVLEKNMGLTNTGRKGEVRDKQMAIWIHISKILAALLHTNQAAFDPRWLYLGYSKKAAASLNYATGCCHHSGLSKGKDRNQSGTDRYVRSLFTAHV